MTDLEPILALWRSAEAASLDYVLAAVAAVVGASYRKPGARLILAADGRRAGTVSGGCLEAEVARRAFWRTQSGPVLESYSTFADDGEHPWGSGCGGQVWILLERPATACPLLAAIEQSFAARQPLAIATLLDGPPLAHRAFAPPEPPSVPESAPLAALAHQAFESRRGATTTLDFPSGPARVWSEYRPARPALWVLGAGDDARPLVRLARELGWLVVLADGRAHLATRERFPEAHEILTLPMVGPDLDPLCQALSTLRPTDAAVALTHSFDQDARILAVLNTLQTRPSYLGVLGPRRRTRELVEESLRLRARFPSPAQIDPALIDADLANLHAPTGLVLGGDTPAAIALAILAEAHLTIQAATGLPLRHLRH